MRDIAKSNERKKGGPLGKSRLLIVLAATLPISGCFGGGMDLFGSDVDRSISTNTVAQKNTAEGRSDELTVQNAVSSADLSRTSSPLPWANATTGSAGVVTAIEEQKSNGVVCRNFSTTRHSYEGIAYFSGKTCTAGSGQWQLMSFSRQP
ncbi:RT0821/Lpp0805 family surface protein [Ciceribacter selenitireducens]|uniref:RT0821/Lpp0805 family surface protein n=1 Tax=Ciceribacter selenitireducens TaxID=448181 RepID=UPI00048DF22D